MSVFKCKMCGGTLNITEGSTVAVCEYCGTRQTVPSLDNEKKVNLFTRANRLRAACEFDKAYGVYESIVAEFPEEAEAYWGLILCKYGIEYVDDPRTGKKIPTCHRSSFDGVFDDANFELVMEYSDSLSRAVYREEAKEIERLRTRILEVSSKEEPYDIFICYKETDENGERTIDSVIAQDVYDVLTEKGYKVFFSRITLEDKLGQEYEPYIFAALNSAKVMLAFGTDYEYYNAVWVKNEWSRYLSLIEKGEKKVLIPCYKGIDAYDMPAEFKRLQAQDMGKVGAIQDLVRGIEKIIGKKGDSAENGANKASVGFINAGAFMAGPTAQVAPLLKRAFMFLEDKNWAEAENYCERVLDLDPENGDAYLGKLMADLRVQNRERLSETEKPLERNVNYRKVIRYGAEELVSNVRAANDTIVNRNAEKERVLRVEAEEKERALRMEAEEKERALRLKAEGIAAPVLFRILHSKDYEEVEALKRDLQTIETIHDDINHLEEIEKNLQKAVDELKRKRDQLSVFAISEKKKVSEELERTATRLVNVRERIRNEKLKAQRLVPQRSEKQERLRQLERILKQAPVMKYRAAMEEMKKTHTGIDVLEEHGLTFLQAELILFKNEWDIIEFGKYPQKRDGGIAPIQWIVLKKEEERVLLLSRLALDVTLYHANPGNVRWNDCSLRFWLNRAFINTAFQKADQAIITYDGIFCLSKDELERYMPHQGFSLSREHLKLWGTEYCCSKGIVTSVTDICPWWLRSDNQISSIPYVDTAGEISPTGWPATASRAIRPALWVSLKTPELKAVCSDRDVSIEDVNTLEGTTAEKEIQQIRQNRVATDNTIEFGKYPQDAYGEKKNIEWIVLEKKDNRMLLISKYLLNARPYHDTQMDVTWQTCNLRQWLNEEFISDAFSSAEQKKILDTYVKAERDLEYNASPGEDTIDKVFLLSSLEAHAYFVADTDRIAERTVYTSCLNYVKKDVEAYTKDGMDIGDRWYWWLRSPGYDQQEVVIVDHQGSLIPLPVDVSVCGIRPALWIDLDA